MLKIINYLSYFLYFFGNLLVIINIPNTQAQIFLSTYSLSSLFIGPLSFIFFSKYIDKNIQIKFLIIFINLSLFFLIENISYVYIVYTLNLFFCDLFSSQMKNQKLNFLFKLVLFVTVIPLILKAKSENIKEVPLTDERMTRFFISLTDAVKFVIRGLNLMDKGEIFVPKMPSVYIKDLIKTVYPSCKFKKIGIRPGEKIDELLISENESSDAYEIKGGYVLISKKTYFASKLKEKLKKNKNLFEYNSRDNNQFLSRKQISELLKNKLL